MRKLGFGMEAPVSWEIYPFAKRSAPRFIPEEVEGMPFSCRLNHVEDLGM